MLVRLLRKTLVVAAVGVLVVSWASWTVHRKQNLQHKSLTPLSTLIIAQGSDMETMESDNLNSANSVSIADLIWGRLLNITAEGKIVPSMASRYQWNEAGNAITFRLRPGLKCEDGSPFTARDVAFTLNRAADKKLGFYGNLPGFVFPAIGFVGAHADSDLDATVRVRAYSSQVPGMLSQAYMLCQAS